MYLIVYREKITLKIVDEKQNTETYNEVDIKDQLCLYIKKFAETTKANYSQLYALYNGRSLLDERLNIPIDKIINSQDKKDKYMILLIYQDTESEKRYQDEITIILSIESAKIEKLKGKRGETLRDAIINSSQIKLDLKWCIIKYGKYGIDLNQKFDDIANEEDKKNLKIDLTVTFTIPLMVTFVKNNEKTKIPCLLSYKVDDVIECYCKENKLNKEDCYFFPKNGKYDFRYKKFSELVLDDDQILNKFPNERINNTDNFYNSSENFAQTNQTIINIKEKMNYNSLSILQEKEKETDVNQLEMEITVFKQCFCARHKDIIYCLYALLWMLILLGVIIVIIWKLWKFIF